MTQKRGLTLVPADAHPCAFSYPVRLAVVSVIQAGLASDGGWARLNLAVMTDASLAALRLRPS